MARVTGQFAIATADELAAGRQWLAIRDYWKHGRCQICERIRDEAGRPLIVARGRKRLFRRFSCWRARRRRGRREA